jgi:hypothetical protein
MNSLRKQGVFAATKPPIASGSSPIQ